MKKVLLSSVVALSLSGCATMPGSDPRANFDNLCNIALPVAYQAFLTAAQFTKAITPEMRQRANFAKREADAICASQPTDFTAATVQILGAIGRIAAWQRR